MEATWKRCYGSLFLKESKGFPDRGIRRETAADDTKYNVRCLERILNARQREVDERMVEMRMER